MNNSGKNLGNGRGLGKGGGKGRNNGGALGPNGACECPKCHTKLAHKRGISCTDIKCPNCGNKMIREDLLYKNKELR